MKQPIPRSNTRKAPAGKTAKQKLLSEQQVQYLKVIFGISFLLSLTLELYVFGFPDGFFIRWFSTLLVVFLLLSLTVMAIIPFVNYVVNRWLKF